LTELDTGGKRRKEPTRLPFRSSMAVLTLDRWNLPSATASPCRHRRAERPGGYRPGAGGGPAFAGRGRTWACPSCSRPASTRRTARRC
jgi:hypothetical protein